MPHKDPEAKKRYFREYNKKRYHERREEALKILGGCCVHCGGTYLLQFDHKVWEEKTTRACDFKTLSRARFLKEVAKCQLLCFDCHVEKSRADLSVQATIRQAKAPELLSVDPETAEEVLVLVRRIRAHVMRHAPISMRSLYAS